MFKRRKIGPRGRDLVQELDMYLIEVIEEESGFDILKCTSRPNIYREFVFQMTLGVHYLQEQLKASFVEKIG